MDVDQVPPRPVVERAPVPPAPQPAPQPALPPARARRSPAVTLALVVGVLVVALSAAFLLVTSGLERLNPFRDGVVQQTTVDRSGPAVLRAVTDLGEFRAASGYYELVVDVEKDVSYVPSFLAGRRVLFVAAGSVDVGVDLRGLGEGSIVVDATRTGATITLPKPVLSTPRVDVDRSYVYSRESGVLDKVRDAVGGGPTEEKELYSLASRRLAEAAAATGELTTRAETNTRAMLQGLLRPLGFTRVTVVFTG